MKKISKDKSVKLTQNELEELGEEVIKEIRALIKKCNQIETFYKENPLVIDDELYERFESWLADRK